VSLTLADLSSIALRRLGIERKYLIDTEKDQYPITREWAKAIHAQDPRVQGLCWTSRQDDTARAYMLFGDRVSPGSFRTVGEPRPLMEHADTCDAVFELAERIGVAVVPGRT
jgi:hypothetical protein